MQSRKPIENDQVREVFANYPAAMRKRLLDLRDLILATADETDGVGQIVECLKWGQPAYLTERPKSGSTIRIDAIRGEHGLYGLFVHCRTRLVPIFRDHYDGQLSFDGNRAVILSMNEPVPVAPLKHCVAMALTYHLKRQRISEKAAETCRTSGMRGECST